MEYLSHLLFFLLALPGIFSDAYPQDLRGGGEGQRRCEALFRKWIDAPHFVCGHCDDGYKSDREGECFPDTDNGGPQLDVLEENRNLGVDEEIDQLAERRSKQEESNNVISSELVAPHGQDAQIPDNAQIHRILHAPGHSQDRKVHDVYRAAAAEDAAAAAAAAAAAPEAPPGALRTDDIHKQQHAMHDDGNMADVYFLAVVAGCSIAGLVGLVVAGVCWYRLQKNVKAASETEYPAYGITGPVPEKVASPGDRKLAQSAQMYHYQHQKQQMIAMEKANGDMTKDGSDADSEEENEEGDYTVYECPGLAPTGEMEVKNPLFSEETPVTPSDPALPPK
jgi:hypothetical protein